jgi:hypothetical protein
MKTDTLGGLKQEIPRRSSHINTVCTCQICKGSLRGAVAFVL